MGGEPAQAAAGPVDRLTAFRAAGPAVSEAPKPVERGAADAALLRHAAVVSAAMGRVGAATARLKDPNLGLAAYEHASREATTATQEARDAAAELLGDEEQPERRWDWRRRAAGQATARLQQVLVQAASTQISLGVRAHLAVREEAHARVRAGLERQIVLACPHAKDARLDHLSEDALQQFVQEAAVGTRSDRGLVGSARTLRSVEESVGQLREMLVQFSILVEAQSEQVTAAGRAVEIANVHVHDAEKHLELARESHEVYMRAKLVLYIVAFLVLFFLFGGFGALPEWLGFAREAMVQKSAEQMRMEYVGVTRDGDVDPRIYSSRATPGEIVRAEGAFTRWADVPGIAGKPDPPERAPVPRAVMLQAEPDEARASITVAEPAFAETAVSAEGRPDPKLRPCRNCLLLHD